MEFEVGHEQPYIDKHFYDLSCYRLYNRLKYVGIILSAFFLGLGCISTFMDKNKSISWIFVVCSVVILAVTTAIYIYITKKYLPKAWKFHLSERVSFFDCYMGVDRFYSTDKYSIEESTEISYKDIETIRWYKSAEIIAIYCIPGTTYTQYRKTRFKKNRIKEKEYVPKEGYFTIYLAFDEMTDFLEILRQAANKKIVVHR